MKILFTVLLLCGMSFGVTYHVNNSTGSSSNTCTQAQNPSTPKDTIQNGLNCESGADLVIVHQGTGSYSESPTVATGTGSGSYNAVTVNTGDTVNVTGGFTLNSHTKVSGFTLSHTGSCITLASTATDVFIGPSNSLTSCGTITINSGNSFIFIQSNTMAYAGCVPPNPVSTCGRWINVFGSHTMIEGNNMSHYQLGIVYGGASVGITNTVIRNNVFHDQLETEAGSNGHTDSVFSEPGAAAANTLIEGNIQYNSVGPNAKGFLSQNDSGCAATCTQLIIRFNIENRTGSGAITNDKSWPNVNMYNDTMVDEGQESGFNTPGGGGDNMLSTGGGMLARNNIWYEGTASFSSWNPVMCNSCVSFGYSLAFCVNTCTIFNHVYQGSTFTADTGNKNVDPKFVNYIGVGNASNDFHLQSGSPAIASGKSLTTVAAGDSGTGTTLILNNVSPFQDGYGLSNAVTTMQGDTICVTTVSNCVAITAVNYGTNTATLAGSITRANGDEVWLQKKSDNVTVLTGAAPDMGALPFTSSSTYTITISAVTGNGTVTSSDSVISCATGATGTCVDSTATGTVTLTATPSVGYVFSTWGGSCSGSSLTFNVTTTATCSATFIASPSITNRNVMVSDLFWTIVHDIKKGMLLE